ncbi:MAG: RlmE family RNA methyltransferase [Candidatus Eutrophobiaceae bacterium]
MTRSKGKSHWRQRQDQDPWVRAARQRKWRSRAAFKLAEIDQRDKLIRKGQIIIDLGAAPGGWSEYAAGQLDGRGQILALDLLSMDAIPGVKLMQGDFTASEILQNCLEWLAGRRADLVLSDMTPNISGVRSTDQARSLELQGCVADFAVQALRPRGTLLVKAFAGSGDQEYNARLASEYACVAVRKPKASRPDSREFYLLAQGKR